MKPPWVKDRRLTGDLLGWAVAGVLAFYCGIVAFFIPPASAKLTWGVTTLGTITTFVVAWGLTVAIDKVGRRKYLPFEDEV